MVKQRESIGQLSEGRQLSLHALHISLALQVFQRSEETKCFCCLSDKTLLGNGETEEVHPSMSDVSVLCLRSILYCIMCLYLCNILHALHTDAPQYFLAQISP